VASEVYEDIKPAELKIPGFSGRSKTEYSKTNVGAEDLRVKPPKEAESDNYNRSTNPRWEYGAYSATDVGKEDLRSSAQQAASDESNASTFEDPRDRSRRRIGEYSASNLGREDLRAHPQKKETEAPIPQQSKSTRVNVYDTLGSNRSFSYYREDLRTQPSFPPPETVPPKGAMARRSAASTAVEDSESADVKATGTKGIKKEKAPETKGENEKGKESEREKEMESEKEMEEEMEMEEVAREEDEKEEGLVEQEIEADLEDEHEHVTEGSDMVNPGSNEVVKGSTDSQTPAPPVTVTEEGGKLPLIAFGSAAVIVVVALVLVLSAILRKKVPADLDDEQNVDV